MTKPGRQSKSWGRSAIQRRAALMLGTWVAACSFVHAAKAVALRQWIECRYLSPYLAMSRIGTGSDETVFLIRLDPRNLTKYETITELGRHVRPWSSGGCFSGLVRVGRRRRRFTVMDMHGAATREITAEGLIDLLGDTGGYIAYPRGSELRMYRPADFRVFDAEGKELSRFRRRGDRIHQMAISQDGFVGAIVGPTSAREKKTFILLSPTGTITKEIVLGACGPRPAGGRISMFGPRAAFTYVPGAELRLTASDQILRVVAPDQEGLFINVPKDRRGSAVWLREDLLALKGGRTVHMYDTRAREWTDPPLAFSGMTLSDDWLVEDGIAITVPSNRTGTKWIEGVDIESGRKVYSRKLRSGTKGASVKVFYRTENGIVAVFRHRIFNVALGR